MKLVTSVTFYCCHELFLVFDVSESKVYILGLKRCSFSPVSIRLLHKGREKMGVCRGWQEISPDYVAKEIYPLNHLINFKYISNNLFLNNPCSDWRMNSWFANR